MNQVELFNEVINKFLFDYKKNRKPIEISIRDIVSNLKYSDRSRHFIHNYPAKLLMHIPYFFLNNEILSKPNSIVLDPFCGSGTVLLESLLSGRNSVGFDINPLAILISKVKTTNFKESKLFKYKIFIENFYIKNLKVKKIDCKNLDFWFSKRIISELSNLLYIIKKINNLKYRSFFLLCFSSCVRKVSFADPKVSVPVKLKKDTYPENHPFRKYTVKKLKQLKSLNVKVEFLKIVEQNISKIRNSSNEIFGNTKSIIYKLDTRKSNQVFNDLQNKIDLVITSPPYAGAQKYARASSLNLKLLGHLKNSYLELDKFMLGRENFKKKEYEKQLKTQIMDADALLKKIYCVNPIRACLAANYLNELRQSISLTAKLLKKNAYYIIVIGNNEICGFEFKTNEYLKQIFKKLGLKLELELIDDIKSFGLMTKRNKTANIISRESILIFKKHD